MPTTLEIITRVLLTKKEYGKCSTDMQGICDLINRKTGCKATTETLTIALEKNGFTKTDDHDKTGGFRVSDVSLLFFPETHTGDFTAVDKAALVGSVMLKWQHDRKMIESDGFCDCGYLMRASDMLCCSIFEKGPAHFGMQLRDEVTSEMYWQGTSPESFATGEIEKAAETILGDCGLHFK